MKNNTATAISAMSTEQFKSRAWELMTNIRQCGGASVKGARVARRRFRALGGKFYLAICGEWTDDTATGEEMYRTWGVWGIVWPGDSLPQADIIATGASLSHAAHKLGDGDARKGWNRYHAN